MYLVTLISILPWILRLTEQLSLLTQVFVFLQTQTYLFQEDFLSDSSSQGSILSAEEIHSSGTAYPAITLFSSSNPGLTNGFTLLYLHR
jgi:hypothetical protein